MAYFKDLSPYRYAGIHQQGILHVGWLDGSHPFPKGEVSGEALEAMEELAKFPVEEYRGFHTCEICEPPEGLTVTDFDNWLAWAEPRSGNGEIRVRHGDFTFAAPTLIVHYIKEHGYCPPDEFLQALEESPNPPFSLI